MEMVVIHFHGTVVPHQMQVTAHTLTTWWQEDVKLILVIEGNRARQVRQTGNTLEQSHFRLHSDVDRAA